MTPLLHTYNQPFSPNSSSSIPSISSTSSTSNKDELIIPQHWRPEVEQCIKDKILSVRARNEIIRNGNISFGYREVLIKYEQKVRIRFLTVTFVRWYNKICDPF